MSDLNALEILSRDRDVWKARAEAAEARVAELTTVKKNRGMSVNDGRVECPTCGDYVDGSVIKHFAPLNAENAALRERVASYEAKLLADTALMNKANEALHHVTRLYAAEGEKLAASERALEEVTCHQKDCTGLLLNLEDEFHSAEEKLAVAIQERDSFEKKWMDLEGNRAVCCMKMEDDLKAAEEKLAVAIAALTTINRERHQMSAVVMALGAKAALEKLGVE